MKENNHKPGAATTSNTQLVDSSGKVFVQRATLRERWQRLSSLVRSLVITIAAVIAGLAALLTNIERIQKYLHFGSQSQSIPAIVLKLSNSADSKISVAARGDFFLWLPGTNTKHEVGKYEIFDIGGQPVDNGSFDLSPNQTVTALVRILNQDLFGRYFKRKDCDISLMIRRSAGSLITTENLPFKAKSIAKYVLSVDVGDGNSTPPMESEDEKRARIVSTLADSIATMIESAVDIKKAGWDHFRQRLTMAAAAAGYQTGGSKPGPAERAARRNAITRCLKSTMTNVSAFPVEDINTQSEYLRSVALVIGRPIPIPTGEDADAEMAQSLNMSIEIFVEWLRVGTTIKSDGWDSLQTRVAIICDLLAYDSKILPISSGSSLTKARAEGFGKIAEALGKYSTHYKNEPLTIRPSIVAGVCDAFGIAAQ